MKITAFVAIAFFLKFQISYGGEIPLPLESFDGTASLSSNLVTLTTADSSISYTINRDRLKVRNLQSTHRCAVQIDFLAKQICVPKSNSSNLIDLQTAARKVENSWICSNRKPDALFYYIDDESAKKISLVKLRSVLKKENLNDLNPSEFIMCLKNLSKIERFRPGLITCKNENESTISCTSGLVLNTFEGKNNYLKQISVLCGIPHALASDLNFIKDLTGVFPGAGFGVSSSSSTELAANSQIAKSSAIPKELACQGCGKLAQQIQQTNDPGIRNQLIQQLGTRLRPALVTAFGSSAAYAGSRSTVSTGSSPTRNFSGSSSARPRLPASYTGSKQNSFSNADASNTESSTGTDSGLGISTDSSTPGRGGQNVETSAQASSSSTLSRESASTDGPGGGNPSGSAGITGSAQGGGGGGSSESAPPSDTFLGGNLTAQQQGIKSRLTAAPSADRARLVQTRQMISELANNGVQVRFSYKTDTYGVPKTGSPEIIWIIDRQGKITEYNPN